SSDGTAEAVRERYPTVRLIENRENLGFAAANNLGIVQARGKYICLINPDVELLDDCLGVLCRFMDENPNVGICGPKIMNSDGSIQHSCRVYPTLWNNLCFALGLHRLFPRSPLFGNELMSYFDHKKLREVDALSGCFMVVRRKAMEEVGLLDDTFFMYSEDVDWCKRFHDKGWKVVFNPVTKAMHYGGGSSANVSVSSSVEQEKAILQYWAKHHGVIDTTLIRVILLIKHALRMIPSAVAYVIKPGEKKQIIDRLNSDTACMRGAMVFRAGVKCTSAGGGSLDDV
ncbi:MAG: glycosyltransferase family 2 protein, partial [Syntrophales bacterium LBB04]|nr:glycosyltransferase family 2 protein [Syntrophales bacterium LBB04]